MGLSRLNNPLGQTRSDPRQKLQVFQRCRIWVYTFVQFGGGRGNPLNTGIYLFNLDNDLVTADVSRAPLLPPQYDASHEYYKQERSESSLFGFGQREVA
jgi:hypothetical protein